MIVFCAIERALTFALERARTCAAPSIRHRRVAATAWGRTSTRTHTPSTRRSVEGNGRRTRAAQSAAGHVLSVIFTTKDYILFGSKSAFLAVVPGRNHSAKSNTSAHSSFSLLKSSLEAPACVTPVVGQALSMAQN